MQVLLVGYAVLWVVLTLDTLRLVRLVKTKPLARGFVAGLATVALVVAAGAAGYGAYLAGVDPGHGQRRSSAAASTPRRSTAGTTSCCSAATPDRTGPGSARTASRWSASTPPPARPTMIGIPRNIEHVRFREGSPLYGPFPNGYDCGDDCLISYLYTYAEEHPELYPDAAAHGSRRPASRRRGTPIAGVLGIKLQYYVLIDMQGFSDLIDALGGITIDVKQRQPIGGGENRNGQPINVVGWIEPGRAEHGRLHRALVRPGPARHRATYDRMARQRDVQEAILTQFAPATC